MEPLMRKLIGFDCEGLRLTGTLDDAAGSVGVLIVSGGNEIRIGAHRGMAKLAQDLASDGIPVLRFDRRGVGDSEGENGGFEASGPDIAAAIRAFRSACPHVTRLVAFGNCDAASALLLHAPQGINALVLSNIWILEAREEENALPPAAEIRSRYREKLRNPREWLRLFTGAVDLRKLVKGVLATLRPPAPPSSLALRVASGLRDFPGPVTILLAARDGTALAFAEAWESANFAEVRAKPGVSVRRIETASHSFAPAADYAQLKFAIIAATRG